MKLAYKNLLKFIKTYPNYVNQYNINYNIRNFLFDTCELVSSEWLNGTQNLSFIKDFPPKEKDSYTFGDCLDICLSIKSDTIVLKLLVWDGDSFNGHRTNKRCLYTFKVLKSSKEVIDMINNIAISTLEYIAFSKYQQYLKEQENTAIKNIADSLIRELYEA
jgi:hypothetical protein